MTTLAPPPFPDILKDTHRGLLRIPPPTGRLEKVVADAVAVLAKKYADDLDKAEETIEKYGLTIEVTRLRDRLARVASTDLQRLLLSTPGVAEALFNVAIEQELEQEEEEGTYFMSAKKASAPKLGKSKAAAKKASPAKTARPKLGKSKSKVAAKKAAPTGKKASSAKEPSAPSTTGGSTS